jgi:hypothetical protein
VFAPLAGMGKRAWAGELTGYGAVYGLGLAVAFVAVPWAAAWLTQRLAAGRPGAPGGVFFATLTALVAGVFWNAWERSEARDETISGQAKALAHQIRQGGVSAGGAGPGGGTGGDGTNVAIVEAQKATRAHLQAARLAYENAAEAASPRRWLERGILETREGLQAARGEAETYAQAVRMVQEAEELTAHQFSTELRARRVPESAVRDAVAAYREATERALPRLRRLREKDAAIGLWLGEFLDFAELERGFWRMETSGPAGKARVVFEREAAQKKYEALMATAKVLEEERRKLRAEAAR